MTNFAVYYFSLLISLYTMGDAGSSVAFSGQYIYIIICLRIYSFEIHFAYEMNCISVKIQFHRKWLIFFFFFKIIFWWNGIAVILLFFEHLIGIFKIN